MTGAQERSKTFDICQPFATCTLPLMEGFVAS